jgi:signal transduction histidine kinase
MKRDGGLFSQEEIEIARTIGERLIDVRASVEMARRLMDLQRRRMVESQVLDQRTRRTLHDETLPRLHAAMLAMSNLGSAPGQEISTAIDLLGEVHRQLANLLRDMPPATAPELARSGLVGAIRVVVEEEFQGAFDDVSWQISPEAGLRCDDLPVLTAEVLYYALRESIRNAAIHARQQVGERPLQIRLEFAWRQGLRISVEDNGRGMPGSESEEDIFGHGLSLHSTMMAVVGGSLEVESVPDEYTRVILTLPPSAWR